MKRSFVLALAAGLIASVAFTAPTQAGTVVTTTAFFSLEPASARATAWEFFYADSANNPLGSLTGVSVTNTGGLTGLSFSIVDANEVKFTFDAANHTTGTDAPTAGLQFTFNTTNAASDVFLSGQPNITETGAHKVVNIAAITAVPEPASMALFGIGISGLIALRRFFKRPSVA